MKGHFVAKAMLGKNGTQQPHSVAPNLFFYIQTRGHNVSPEIRWGIFMRECAGNMLRPKIAPQTLCELAQSKCT